MSAARMIGSYHVLDKLGEGAMGVVRRRPASTCAQSSCVPAHANPSPPAACALSPQPGRVAAENGTCAQSSPGQLGSSAPRARCPLFLRNSVVPPPKTEHARNQVQPNSAAAVTAGGGQNLGRGSQGGGPQAAQPTVDAARHATPDRPALSRAGHHSSRPWASLASFTACVFGAPARHRARLRRSLSRDPFLGPAGSRALHRRGRRAAAGPRGRARPRDSPRAGGEPGARPQGKSGWRPVPRPSAHDAAADADQPRLRPAELPQAPARARVHRPVQLGPALFGLAAAATNHPRRVALHLDGAGRLAPCRRAVAPGRAPGPRAAPAPHLNSAHVPRSARAGGRGPNANGSPEMARSREVHAGRLRREPACR